MGTRRAKRHSISGGESATLEASLDEVDPYRPRMGARQRSQSISGFFRTTTHRSAEETANMKNGSVTVKPRRSSGDYDAYFNSGVKSKTKTKASPRKFGSVENGGGGGGGGWCSRESAEITSPRVEMGEATLL